MSHCNIFSYIYLSFFFFSLFPRSRILSKSIYLLILTYNKLVEFHILQGKSSVGQLALLCVSNSGGNEVHNPWKRENILRINFGRAWQEMNYRFSKMQPPGETWVRAGSLDRKIDEHINCSIYQCQKLIFKNVHFSVPDFYRILSHSRCLSKQPNSVHPKKRKSSCGD
jgi:hypothetical protein